MTVKVLVLILLFQKLLMINCSFYWLSIKVLGFIRGVNSLNIGWLIVWVYRHHILWFFWLKRRQDITLQWIIGGRINLWIIYFLCSTQLHIFISRRLLSALIKSWSLCTAHWRFQKAVTIFKSLRTALFELFWIA